MSHPIPSAEEAGVPKLPDLNQATLNWPGVEALLRDIAACTQVTEILYTPDVHLVAVLPAQFELATPYTAAVTTASTHAVAAGQLVALMSGAASLALRQAGGFE